MKKIFAVILAALMLFSLAACGGNEKPVEEKTIVVGYTIYEPMNYLDENGNLVGYDTELAEAVFAFLLISLSNIIIPPYLASCAEK